MSTGTGDNRVILRLPPTLCDWVDQRQRLMHNTTRPDQVRAELLLLRDILAAELRRIELTPGQATCIADVCGASVLSTVVARGAGLVFSECYDAFQRTVYGTKHHRIDEQELLNLLGALGPAADHALYDAIARWWASDGCISGDDKALAASFRAVGMTITDEPAKREDAVRP